MTQVYDFISNTNVDAWYYCCPTFYPILKTNPGDFFKDYYSTSFLILSLFFFFYKIDKIDAERF